jgi:hypothetical protein
MVFLPKPVEIYRMSASNFSLLEDTLNSTRFGRNIPLISTTSATHTTALRQELHQLHQLHHHLHTMTRTASVRKWILGGFRVQQSMGILSLLTTFKVWHLCTEEIHTKLDSHLWGNQPMCFRT